MSYQRGSKWLNTKMLWERSCNWKQIFGSEHALKNISQHFAFSAINAMSFHLREIMFPILLIILFGKVCILLYRKEENHFPEYSDSLTSGPTPISRTAHWRNRQTNCTATSKRICPVKSHHSVLVARYRIRLSLRSVCYMSSLPIDVFLPSHCFSLYQYKKILCHFPFFICSGKLVYEWNKAIV